MTGVRDRFSKLRRSDDARTNALCVITAHTHLQQVVALSRSIQYASVASLLRHRTQTRDEVTYLSTRININKKSKYKASGRRDRNARGDETASRRSGRTKIDVASKRGKTIGLESKRDQSEPLKSIVCSKYETETQTREKPMSTTD